jgi:hypothetical protein
MLLAKLILPHSEDASNGRTFVSIVAYKSLFVSN